MTRYVNQTQLGGAIGATSHEVGRFLTQIGLRDGPNKPSSKAFKEGFVKTAPTGRGDGYYYVWNEDKTVTALQAAGRRRAGAEPEAKPTTPNLTGPFVVAGERGEWYGIKDCNGVLRVWVDGEANAQIVTRLLNLANQCHKLTI